MADFCSQETEDLILKDSPLDQYLKEIGISDFDSYSSLAYDGNSQKVSNEEQSPSVVAEQSLGQSPRTDSSFHTFIFFMNEYLFPNSSFSVRTSLENIMYLLANSKILCDVKKSEKDSTVINDALSENLGSIRPFKKGDTEGGNLTGKRLTWTSFIVLLICVLMAFILRLTSYQSLMFFAVPLVILVASAIAYRLYVQQETPKLCSKTVQLTKVFIGNFETIFKSFDKSFLLIRECEIISQGYTFYHPGIPALKSGCRKRGSCVTLRDAVVENSLTLFEVIASAAKLLIMCLPKDYHLIYAEDGIFNVSLDELKSSIAEIKLKENGIPPTDLVRSMICLIKSECVELFQIILLLVENHLSGEEAFSHNSSDVQKLLLTLSEIYSKNNITTNHILDDMDLKYAFVKENEFKEHSPSNKPKFSFPSCPVQLKIDSAFLHLKSAMGHLEYLESVLPKNLMSDGYSEVDDDISGKVHQFFTLFNHDVGCAKECVDDINKSLSSNLDGIAVDKSPFLSTLEGSEQVSDLEFIDCDSPMQQEGDLLLEGMSDPSHDQDEFLRTEQSILEERRLKEQVNENERLVKELKVLFSFKKSPIGLVSLDLVKENMPTVSSTVDDLSHDVMAEQDFSMNENSTQILYDPALENGTGNTSHTTEGARSSWNEHELAVNRTPTVSMLNDLRLALMHRQQQGLLKEYMVEADTCNSDVAGVSENVS